MNKSYDLIVRDAYISEQEEIVDIGLQDGVISRIDDQIDNEGTTEIEANGNFVSSGFCDCHRHLEMAFSADGSRFPKMNSGLVTVEDFHRNLRDHFESNSVEEITSNIIKAINKSVSAGTTHIRTHVMVGDVPSIDLLEANIRAREATKDIVDLQLVVYASHGILANDNEDLIIEAIRKDEEGRENGNLLLGGIDPASRNRNAEVPIQKWFDIASDWNIDMDIHAQEIGTLGEYLLERMIDYMKEYDYQGRVTASHSFSLADLPDWKLESLIQSSKEVDLKYVTCYTSTPASMPIRTLFDEDVVLGHGTDNTRDFGIPSGSCDSLEGLLIQVHKLKRSKWEEERKWFESNPGMETLWDMLTYQGAKVVGKNDYGIQEGNKADLVVLDEPSLQWSILKQANRSHVIKDGQVVASDEEILPEFDSLA